MYPLKHITCNLDSQININHLENNDFLITIFESSIMHNIRCCGLRLHYIYTWIIYYKSSLSSTYRMIKIPRGCRIPNTPTRRRKITPQRNAAIIHGSARLFFISLLHYSKHRTSSGILKKLMPLRACSVTFSICGKAKIAGNSSSKEQPKNFKPLEF